MDYKALSELLFPDVKDTLQDYEIRYPWRDLPKEAMVTRLAPSPTGFIHLGNLYQALANERLAHQSQGRFILRIEDTDEKRKVEGAIELLVSTLAYFGINFDEGILCNPQGDYAPYQQSERRDLYGAAAKFLVANDCAYPCFCSEEELALSHQRQADEKADFGYYGIYAKCRDLTIDQVKDKLSQHIPFTIRLKAKGDPNGTFTIHDGIRGDLTMPQNTNDTVLLKSNGLPTYHFAHAVDDHFMRVTHVIRGEEWLSTLPVHVQLFEYLQFPLPVYCHTTLLLKQDGEIRRKLSKRKDPELSLEYYKSLGYHPLAVKEYLMRVLNSNYEAWRDENPKADLTGFSFTTAKMGSSGALFDLSKLNDVSKDILADLSVEALCDFFLDWVKDYDQDNLTIYNDKAYLKRIFMVGRYDNNPRKDLIYGKQITEKIAFYFDTLFAIKEGLPPAIDNASAKELITAYLETMDISDDKETWFNKVRALCEVHNYALKAKLIQKEPGKYRGHIGEVTAVFRLALAGTLNAPDLWELQQAMGEQRVVERLQKLYNAL
ncbi:MAG: glutamate--tRNA ligase [Erysipelotrichaceae bacterium]|nr:glutamate--tRNA ligase [Erysipelotrichaceae bacterium]